MDDLILRVDVVGLPVSPGDALTRWLRCLPNLVLSGLATLAGVVVAVLGGAIAVVTGRRPTRLLRFLVWVMRVRARTFAWYFLLAPDRPAVPALGLSDDGTSAATEVTASPSPTIARWSPPARLLAMVPSIVIGLAIGILADLLYPVIVVVAAARRGLPDRWAAFLADLEVWAVHVFLYLFLATDVLPSIAPPRRGGVEVQLDDA